MYVQPVFLVNITRIALVPYKLLSWLEFNHILVKFNQDVFRVYSFSEVLTQNLLWKYKKVTLKMKISIF